MNRVLTASAPYFFGGLDSLSRGRQLLMRQYRYPDTYDARDSHTGDDHDRIESGHGHAHARACYQKHLKTLGGAGIGFWVRETTHAKALAFCVEFLKADPAVAWTGYRVLGTVNVSSGHTVWTISVFAKHPESDTQVYSGENAPNVAPPQPNYLDPNGRERM